MTENRQDLKNDNLKIDAADAHLLASLYHALHTTAEEDFGLPPVQEYTSRERTGFRDASELFYLVIARIKYILLAAVLFAALFGVYAFYLHEPVYAATAKLYIMGEDSSSILADFQIGSYLTMDYQEVFKTWEVHEMVRSQLNLPYSYEDMEEMLTVSNPSDTRILYITVKNADPSLATDMANAYAEAAKQFILETMDSEEPSTFSVALVPGTATGIRRTTYVIIGVLVGTFFAVAVILLRELLDNRPKTPEDIAQCAHIPTLAIIPSMVMGKKHAKEKSGRDK